MPSYCSEGISIGDAQLLFFTVRCVEHGGDVPFLQLFVDLKTHAVYEYQFNTQMAQKGEVMDKRFEAAGVEDVATKPDDKCFAAMGIDVGRSLPQPVNRPFAILLAFQLIPVFV